MWIAGLVLLVASAGLVFAYLRTKSRSAVFADTDTSTVEFLESIAKDLGTQMSYFAEVKGTVECDSPLQSELAEMACVYYSMSVKRKYEETYYTTDSEGRRTRKTRTGSDLVSSNERSVPFVVRDSSGAIAIRPDGAEFIAEKVLSRFEPESVATSGFRLGKFSFNAGGVSGFRNDRRTLGYQFEERAIPLDRELYVLGEVCGTPGNLAIQRPSDDQRFILSTKSEAQLQREAAQSTKLILFGAIACGIIGVVLLVVGILQDGGSTL